MRRIGLSLSLLFVTLSVIAQKKEEGFDANFKPSPYIARYYVSTEKKDTRWHREAFYLPEKSMAMEAWYKDSACAIPDGEYRWFHSNKNLRNAGIYKDGKKEGVWLRFHENGMMNDSSNYVADHRIGPGLRWNNEGSLIDSSNFDGAGNGTEVRWYNEGMISETGFWISDTSKHKTWQYFHKNGKLLATEVYDHGKRLSVACFDDTGKPLPTCKEEEANFDGGESGWRSFVERNLRGMVPINRRAPVGVYTVMMLFTVDTDGQLIEIKPLTKFGYGMEEEVTRMIKSSPRWNPAIQFGRNVKAYRKQPITFQVTQD